jgi:hypothetical protein
MLSSNPCVLMLLHSFGQLALAMSLKFGDVLAALFLRKLNKYGKYI